MSEDTIKLLNLLEIEVDKIEELIKDVQLTMRALWLEIEEE